MRDFPRPKPVEVTIFGEPHSLRRISFVDFTEIVPEIIERVYHPEEAVTPVQLLDAALPCMNRLLRLSFPSFTEWEELPVEHSVGLLEVIWEENDISGMIENFTSKIQKGMGGKPFPKS